MFDRLQLEKQIKAMADRELLEFVARQQAESIVACANCKAHIDERINSQKTKSLDHENRLKVIENSEKRAARTAGIISIGITGTISLVNLLISWIQNS